MTPIQKRAERVRSMALESVLRLAGATPDPHDRHKWHTSQGVLSVTGPKFMNWTCGLGGGGAIDLVIHLHQRGFREALEWLEHHFPGPASPAGLLGSRPQLKLPAPDSQNLGRVKGYLTIQRRLPPALIHPLIASGLLYADAKANAVFLLLGQQGHRVGAELRGTTQYPWRGMAPGSKKDLGFFAIGPASNSSIILCESAIDAISCLALHPAQRCLSTAGVRSNPRWLTTLLAPGAEIYCGFDADDPGDAMAQRMLDRYPALKRLRPSKKDWNDVLRAR